MKEELSFTEYQKKIDKWILNHGGYWSPLSMFSAIVEELGELAKEINHLEGFKPKKPEDKATKIGEELADVIFAIICVANYYKIDINHELDLAIDKFAKRDSSRFI
ncbi:MAG: nucleotide pyrophosphohydrolase [Candidatus Lokiarchaeota archaeon]|nr:nucleotide pyrophosphohydrolase [Candidatus Lokiarchaeota archaeon]